MIDFSPSTFYYRPTQSRMEREKSDADLCEKIEYLQAHFSCWGYRTLHAQLQRQYAITVNHKRILRVMRKYRLFRRQKRHFFVTTNSNHTHQIYPNLIRGMTVTALNQVWVADITYIRIATGFVFLAAILDLFSRKVIGYAIGKRITHELAVEALQCALRERKPAPGVIHHSDRGVQYASNEYTAVLTAHDFKISMSNRGNPYQNAFAESFFKTLKNEEVYLWEYESFTDVVDRIKQFIDDVYNQKRVHSSLGYLTPSEFENKLSVNEPGTETGPVTKVSDY